VEAYLAAQVQRRRAFLAVIGLTVLIAAAVAGALEARPYRVALLAVAGIAAGLAWTARPRPDPERWLRGAAGESATARLLARLPAGRWAVLHDRRVPGSQTNLDHIVIGRTGVWLVDSKTTRAMVRTGWRSIRLGRRPLETGSTSWEAQVVADRLDTRVRPVIVLHGGELRRRGVRCAGVRVLPAAGLLRRIRRGRRRLSSAEIGALAARADTVFRPAGAAFGQARRFDG
jgi:hypothetical protein